MSPEEPLIWMKNQQKREDGSSPAVDRLLPPGSSRRTRRFHAQLPGYEMTPLKSLPNLAARLGLDCIWVKDESARMRLNAFKALGGSFAIYQYIRERVGLPDLTFDDLMSAEVRRQLGDVTFTSATDGNHGRAIARGERYRALPCAEGVLDLSTRADVASVERRLEGVEARP